jgi:hypothetical protein
MLESKGMRVSRCGSTTGRARCSLRRAYHCRWYQLRVRSSPAPLSHRRLTRPSSYLPSRRLRLHLRVVAEPERVRFVLGKAQVLRAKTGVDEREFLRAGIVDDHLPRVLIKSLGFVVRG